MRRIVYILLFCFASLLKLEAQSTTLKAFDNLIGKTWYAEGTWGDGSLFKQEIRFQYEIENTIITTKSRGFIDKKQTKIGDRNFGIRKYDSNSKSIKFWEFDVFGGVTEGVVLIDGKNFLYQYEYGDTQVTDMWEYIDDSTYNFKVGSYQDGKWIQVYLETKFIAQH